MTELETMQRARMYLDKLAKGIDPISDQPLPGDTALNQVRLSRCFSYVSGILEQVIENGGLPRTKPFFITPQQLAWVQLSPEPIRMIQLTERICDATRDPKMKRPSAKYFSDWLLKNGFLETKEGADGKSRRVPTPAGQQLGISFRMVQGKYGDYETVYYDINAQRFLLDHLFEILPQQS